MSHSRFDGMRYLNEENGDNTVTPRISNSSILSGSDADKRHEDEDN